MGIRKIRGVVKNYAWGNSDFIPSLIGGYTGEAQAELWFGAHHLGDADAGEIKLSTLIHDDESYLGSELYHRYNGRLPLLMKVLAVEKPLSLQCHPNKEEASSGWKRERKDREQGLSVSYQDDNGKSEMVLALSPMTALCGFRDISDIEKDLKVVIPCSYKEDLEADCKDIFSLFNTLFALSDKKRSKLIEEMKKTLSASSTELYSGLFMTRKGISLLSQAEYGSDIGCIFPYLMNVVNLDVGEALAINPGTLHAYIHGNGIEVMNDSDNVLRCGLTRKRVDLEELKRVMDFSTLHVAKSPSSLDAYGRTLFSSPSEDFQLSTAKDGTYHVSGSTLAIVFTVCGEVLLSSRDSVVSLSKGEAAIIPTDYEYTMKVRGFASIAEIGRQN